MKFDELRYFQVANRAPGDSELPGVLGRRFSASHAEGPAAKLGGGTGDATDVYPNNRFFWVDCNMGFNGFLMVFNGI